MFIDEYIRISLLSEPCGAYIYTPNEGIKIAHFITSDLLTYFWGYNDYGLRWVHPGPWIPEHQTVFPVPWLLWYHYGSIPYGSVWYLPFWWMGWVEPTGMPWFAPQAQNPSFWAGYGLGLCWMTYIWARYGPITWRSLKERLDEWATPSFPDCSDLALPTHYDSLKLALKVELEEHRTWAFYLQGRYNKLSDSLAKGTGFDPRTVDDLSVFTDLGVLSHEQVAALANSAKYIQAFTGREPFSREEVRALVTSDVYLEWSTGREIPAELEGFFDSEGIDGLVNNSVGSLQTLGDPAVHSPEGLSALATSAEYIIWLN